MAKKDVAAAGKAFVEELLSRIPEAQRGQVQEVLMSEPVLTLAGEGALKTSDYSRLTDELRTQRQGVETWKTNLDKWYTDNKSKVDGYEEMRQKLERLDASGGGGDLEEVSDLRRELKTLRDELVGVQKDGVGVIVATSMLIARHQSEFGKPLDVKGVMDFAVEKSIPLDTAYDLYTGTERQAKADALLQEQITKAREEGRALGIREALDRPPYPVGATEGNVFDQLSKKPEEFGVDRAVENFTKRMTSTGA